MMNDRDALTIGLVLDSHAYSPFLQRKNREHSFFPWLALESKSGERKSVAYSLPKTGLCCGWWLCSMVCVDGYVREIIEY